LLEHHYLFLGIHQRFGDLPGLLAQVHALPDPLMNDREASRIQWRNSG
jgi:hypothetical protein